MLTQDERLTTLEKTVALLKRSSDAGIQELNRNTTVLLEIVSSQQLDIKEIKISLINVEERLDSIDQRLTSLDLRLTSFEQSVNSRFDVVSQHFDNLDKKFDQVVLVLSKLANKLE